jgi:hypothetical protein
MLQGTDLGGHTVILSPRGDGSFEFTNIQPGAYVLIPQVRLPRGTPINTPGAWRLVVGNQDLAGIPFSLRVEPRTLDGGFGISLAAARTLGRVTVVDETGSVRPIPAGIRVGLTTSAPTQTTISPDGSFTLLAGPGRVVSFSPECRQAIP